MAEQISIKVNESDLRELSREITRLSKKIGVPAMKRVLKKSATAYIQLVRLAAPRSGRIHYTYKTPKLIGRIKAGHGDAEQYRVSAYYPGNLSKSFDVLPLRRLRGAATVIIGPKVQKKQRKGARYGKGRAASGTNAYYAGWVEEGTKNYSGTGFQSKSWEATKDAVLVRLTNLVKRLLR